MKNKFLEKYPKLYEPKIGDRIKIISVPKNNTVSYFQIGAKAIITEIIVHGNRKYYQGDFKKYNNVDKNYTGFCDIGKPVIDFILDTNEK